MSVYAYFHVCAKGNDGQGIFYDDPDRLRYLSLIEKYRTRYKFQCFGYCLMSNHVHLLVKMPSIAVLSKAIQGLHVAYVMYFNHRHKRTGHLFQDRFVSWVVETQEHLVSAKEYIENNPVKAGIVTLREAYRWSSAWRDGSTVTINQLIG